jgi:shikimate kinase
MPEPVSAPSTGIVSLIGYRGTGKSALALKLAEALGWDPVDADVYLEAKYATTIRAIFALEGEAGFRDKESTVLRELVQRDRIVLATGGGVILRPENRALLRSRGPVIWLQATPETIWRRINEDQSTGDRRPNLTAQGGLVEIRELLAQRESLYRECSDWPLTTDEESPEELSHSLLAWLTHHAVRKS